MDKVLVKQLAQIRKQLNASALREAVNSSCSPQVGPLLIAQLGGVITNESVVAQIIPSSLKPHSVEADLYLGLVSLVVLIDNKQYLQATAVADSLIQFVAMKNINNVDLLICKIYFYFVRIYELTGRITETRATLMTAYTSATVHRSATRQAVLINLILRCFYVQGLVDQAQKFVSKITFPETRSNAEYARYLYYVGMIRAIQLEYSESYSFLMQAVRKAPQSTVGTGFRLAATKAGIIVELLMGEIPSKSTFNKPQLAPYLAIAESVRKGDVGAFTNIVNQNEALFVQDRLLSLIRRLHQNVIKAGLRSITSSYSRIMLSDVAKKLQLSSLDEAADVAAKAIIDGVVNAKINYEKQYLESSWGEDIYSTSEPAKQLHKRIAFCLQLHTDAVKAMQYPDVNEIEKELMETNEEILRAQKMDLEDGLDDDDDDMMM